MFVILESTTFKQKGFMSYFKTYTFKCIVLIDNNAIDEITLKAKNGLVGYTLEIPSITNKIELRIECKNWKETYHVNIINQMQEVKINNDKFKGNIKLSITKHNIFTELENRELIRTGCRPVQIHSLVAIPSKTSFVTRETYYGIKYRVDLGTQKMSWVRKGDLMSEDLPAGWARGMTDSGHLFYINHNKNYTQWENPLDKKYAAELESRMLQYRLNVEGINLFNFLDFARFRIDAKRCYSIQSTAKPLLNAKRDDLTKQPILVFEDELGEDYGALIREFFYITSLEFAKDERLKSLGVVFDVKTKEERLNDHETNNEFAKHNHDVSLIDPESQSTQEPFRNSPNILESLFNMHINPDRNGQTGDRFGNFLVTNRSSTVDTTDVSFYIEDNIGKNILCDKDFFIYLGIFVGMAFDHELNIAIDFSLAFYENLMTKNFHIGIVQDLQLQSSLSYILNNNIEDDDILDENGDKITEDTKAAYVDRIVRHILYESKEREYNWIREGFYRVAISGITSFFSAKDLANSLLGNEQLTFQMIKDSVQLLYCTDADKEVKYFWNVLKKQDEHFLRRFLRFLTGSASIPMGGLRGNKFKWYLEFVNDTNPFIRASACVHKLFIGKYDNEETFERLFLYSIYNTEGFHKV